MGSLAVPRPCGGLVGARAGGCALLAVWWCPSRPSRPPTTDSPLSPAISLSQPLSYHSGGLATLVAHSRLLCSPPFPLPLASPFGSLPYASLPTL
eukprot:2301469-Heterocapsa_arctica.AAC.1